MCEKEKIIRAICHEISTCVHHTEEIISDGLKSEHIIQNAAMLLEDASEDLQNYYEAQGYLVQQFRFDENGIEGLLIQIGNESSAFMNTVKSATGLRLAACVKFLSLDKDLQITVCQGRWLDKVMVNVVSWFVLQPLFFTSIIGAWRQKSMLDQIERYLLGYFANHTQREE